MVADALAVAHGHQPPPRRGEAEAGVEERNSETEPQHQKHGEVHAPLSAFAQCVGEEDPGQQA